MTRKSILLISVIIGIIALFSFLNSPYFQIRDFLVKGNKIIYKEEVMAYLKSYNGDNILFLDEAKIKKRLKEQEKYIKEVNIKKSYPDKLNISIIERTPLARIINNGIVLVFDKEGVILENNKKKIRADVPLLKGMGYSFQKNKIDFSKSLEKTIEQLKNIDNTLIKDINLIKYNKRSIKEEVLELTILDNIEVYLGNMDDLNDKFEIMEATIKKIKNEDIDIEYINLKYPEKPVYRLK